MANFAKVNNRVINLDKITWAKKTDDCVFICFEDGTDFRIRSAEGEAEAFWSFICAEAPDLLARDITPNADPFTDADRQEARELNRIGQGG